VRIHSNAESRFHPNREILHNPLFPERDDDLPVSARLLHCNEGGWFGVDPDARRIGPRLVAAFRRRRGPWQLFFLRKSLVFRGILAREAAACAALTNFSFGAQQVLTLVGHNSAQSRRATTDRSGLIAINPSAPLPPA
jgi:hypothetical protein